MVLYLPIWSTDRLIVARLSIVNRVAGGNACSVMLQCPYCSPIQTTDYMVYRQTVARLSIVN